MTKNQASLNHEEVAVAQRNGLTFASRRRNKLVCNQAPRLGCITAKQADSLRAQVWPKTHKKKPVMPPNASTRSWTPPSTKWNPNTSSEERDRAARDLVRALGRGHGF